MTTLVTAAQIATVRRMVNEPTAATYTDALLTAFIERYPLLDELGEEPYEKADYLPTLPPTRVINTDWIPTYDLYAAAADIWDEKAAAVAPNYDFSADGGNYSRSQQFEMYLKQARYYRSRRSLKTIRMVKKPEEPETTDSYVGNINDPYA